MIAISAPPVAALPESLRGVEAVMFGSVRVGRFGRLGVAVVVLGVFMLSISTILQVTAAPNPLESTFVPITPARVLDTRDPTNLGLPGPFVSMAPQKLRITGTIATTTGNRIVVPAGATGVSLNITVVDPSRNGFLTIRPSGLPGTSATSNLNFSAGQVLANAVTVALPTSGASAGSLEIGFDAYGDPDGRTDVLVDVLGYSTTNALRDLQAQIDQMYTRAEVDDLIAANTPIAAYTQGTDLRLMRAAQPLSVVLTPPSDGKVIATYSLRFSYLAEFEPTSTCALTDTTVE